MGMQTDILASQPLTSDGQMLDQAGENITRCRIKAILAVPTANAATVVLKDGGASGATKATINIKAGSTNNEYILLPGEGLLFQTNVYADITEVTHLTVFYA